MRATLFTATDSGSIYAKSATILPSFDIAHHRTKLQGHVLRLRFSKIEHEAQLAYIRQLVAPDSAALAPDRKQRQCAYRSAGKV